MFYRAIQAVCLIGIVSVLVVAYVATLQACPFCAATSQTLTEEMKAADAVVLAKLIGPAKPEEKPADEKKDPAESSLTSRLPGPSKFLVTKILKGKEHLGGKQTIEVLHFGETKPDTVFLITGMALPDTKWATPIPLTPRANEYVSKLLSLPEKGVERLAFFQMYLEDKDSVLAQDAYDEFARAPYADVVSLKDHMQHGKLVEWIQDVNVSPSHRRLYLTMLGVCGGEKDLPMLEEMMQSSDRRTKAGLDAMIACYLTLKGPAGMPLVEDLFLKNKKAEYADTYACIMALRFHGQESDVISRKRLLEGLRHMLDRPELADLVISDLARWEDWSVMDRLVELFKEAKGGSSWVRVPVINYLQAAGRVKGEVGKKALAAIDELTLIDPAAVKQAKAFSAFGALAAPKASTSSGRDTTQEKSTKESKPTTETATPQKKPAAEKPRQEAAAPESGQGAAIEPKSPTPIASTEKPSEQPGQPSNRSSQVATIGGRKVTTVLLLVAVVLIVLRYVSQETATGRSA